jgi:hypothetical protein
MNRLLVVFGILASQFGLAQQAPQPSEQTCGQTYHWGHLVQHDTEDLRVDRTRGATKKQMRELNRQMAGVIAACNSFVREHPNRAVSKELFVRVPGLLSGYDRCESFCGTESELNALTDKEAKATDQK